MAMNDRQFAIASLLMQENLRGIAAGKVQRWEVVKWAVTVNLAVTAALASSANLHKWSLLFSIFAGAVSLTSVYLLSHYNRRTTGYRKMFDVICDRLVADGIKIDSFVGQSIHHPKGRLHDWQELSAHAATIIISSSPVFLVAL